MAVYKTVHDIMLNASRGKTFRGRSVEEPALDELNYYDGELAEFKSLSLTERNILSGIYMPDNFTVPEGVDVLPVGVTAVARAVDTLEGVINLQHTQEVELDPFTNYGRWALTHEHGDIGYSDGKGKKADRDPAVMGRISAQFTGLSDEEVGGLPRTIVGEMLSRPTDMRHVFMKGYLLLSDLNTSVVMRRDRRRFRAWVDNFHPNCPDDRKLGLIAAKRIVVDAEGFSRDELYVLDMMCQAYPSVKYCEDNVYNTCHMGEDDLAIISSRAIQRANRLVHTPQELYRHITNIACKLEATGCMLAAFEEMRGRMPHIRDVNKLSNCRMYHSGVPKSFCHSRAVGGSTRHNVVAMRMPSYLATSAALVADLLLGSCYEVVASLLVEELGGLGKLTYDSTPDGLQLYNSLLRDYGLSSKDSSKNAVMLSWGGIGTRWYRWCPADTWKPYFMALTDELRMGREVLVPQLCLDIVHMEHTSNAWGAIRNFKGLDGCGLASMSDLGKEGERRRDENKRLAASFTWAMGVRRRRPLTYANSYSAKEVSLSSSESRFLKASKGGYRMTMTSFTLDFEPEGREDWSEVSSTALIQACIDGTKCTMVASDEGEWTYNFIVSAEAKGGSEKEEGISETFSAKVREQQEQPDIEPVKARASPKGKEVDRSSTPVPTSALFSKLRSVNRPERVPLSGARLSGLEQEMALTPIPVEDQSKGRAMRAMVAFASDAGVIGRGDDTTLNVAMEGAVNKEFVDDPEQLGVALASAGFGLRLYELSDEGKPECRVTDYGDVGTGFVIGRAEGKIIGIREGEGPVFRVTASDRRTEGDISNDLTLRELRKAWKW